MLTSERGVREASVKGARGQEGGSAPEWTGREAPGQVDRRAALSELREPLHLQGATGIGVAHLLPSYHRYNQWHHSFLRTGAALGALDPLTGIHK